MDWIHISGRDLCWWNDLLFMIEFGVQDFIF